MAVNAIIIGRIAESLQGAETWTKWIVKVYDRKITCFSREDVAEKRNEFSSGDRVRVEGTPNWNEFPPNSGDFSLNMGGCAVDLTEEAEDKATLRATGTFSHEIEVEKDEVGAKFAKVKLDCPCRSKDQKTGEFFDDLAVVLTTVLHEAVDKLELIKSGTKNFTFTGDLDLHPEYLDGYPAYYLEANKVEIAAERGDSNFWDAKPKGLANRKASTPNVRKPKKSSGEGGGGFNDDMPFMYEWR